MRIFNAVLLSVLLAAGVTNAGTVAFYDFDGNGTASVGSTILDSVGGHNGAVAGGDLLYGFDPIAGSYLRFAADGPSVGGLGNRVVIPGNADFVFTTGQAYTIEAIFCTTQTGTNGVIVSKGCDVSNPDSQWWIRHQGNGLLRGSFEGDTGGGIEDTATSASGTLFNDGLWHSIAFVFNGTVASKRLDLYVDGVLKGSDTTIGTSGVVGGTDLDPVVIGEYASLAANRSFAGDIAAVRFSNAALNPAEFLVVPEPSSLAMLACAGALLRLGHRRVGT
jgi:hypothetical protein